MPRQIRDPRMQKWRRCGMASQRKAKQSKQQGRNRVIRLERRRSPQFNTWQPSGRASNTNWCIKTNAGGIVTALFNFRTTFLQPALSVKTAHHFQVILAQANQLQLTRLDVHVHVSAPRAFLRVTLRGQDATSRVAAHSRTGLFIRPCLNKFIERWQAPKPQT